MTTWTCSTCEGVSIADHGADPRIRPTTAPLDEIDRLREDAARLALASNTPGVPNRDVLRNALHVIEDQIDALLMERIARMP